MADRRDQVVVADDDLLREGLAGLLSDPGFDVVGRAGEPASCWPWHASTGPTW